MLGSRQRNILEASGESPLEPLTGSDLSNPNKSWLAPVISHHHVPLPQGLNGSVGLQRGGRKICSPAPVGLPKPSAAPQTHDPTRNMRDPGNLHLQGSARLLDVVLRG